MTSVYHSFLTVPGARRLMVASVLARLPNGMLPLSLILLIREKTGSFAAAGAVVGAFALATAAAAPVQGSLVDRLGQSRVLLVCIAGNSLFLIAVVVAVSANASVLVIGCLVVGAGVLRPPTAACARALWQTISHDPGVRDAAYALDATSQEAIYVVGPLLAGVLASVVAPSAAVLLAVGIGVGGTVYFATAPLSRASGGRSHDRPRGGALGNPGLRILLCSIILIGCGWGAVQVGLPALALNVGLRSLSGILLSLLGVGSVIGGLWYGARRWKMVIETRYRILLVVMALCMTPLIVTRSVPGALILSLLAGVAWAPALSCQYALVGKFARAGVTTEAFTWSNAAMVSGVASGTALAGALVEYVNVGAAFTLGAGVVILAGVCTLFLTRSQREVVVPGAHGS